MKKSTIYVIVVVLLLVILAVYIAKKLVNTGESGEYQPENNDSGGSSGSYSSIQNASFPLKLTSPMKQGGNVKQLQRWLNMKAPYALSETITVDGIFGRNTETLLYNVTGKKEMTKTEFNDNKIYLESSF